MQQPKHSRSFGPHGDHRLIQLTQGQAEQLARLEELWPRHAQLLRSAPSDADLEWLTFRGVEYLARVSVVGGKKVRHRLERRSPQTERQLQSFRDNAARHRRLLKDSTNEIALACRVAKAHGIGRLSGHFAAILSRIWYADIDRRLSLFGGSALFAYEAASGILTPRELTRDGHLQFLARSDDLDKLGLEDIGRACGAGEAGAEAFVQDHSILMRESRDGKVLCEILLPGYFIKRIGRGSQDVLREALNLPCLKAMTVSRDSRPIEISALDPRSYAVAAHCLLGSPAWDARANFAYAMTKDRWPDRFEPAQMSAIRELAAQRFGTEAEIHHDPVVTKSEPDPRPKDVAQRTSKGVSDQPSEGKMYRKG